MRGEWRARVSSSRCSPATAADCSLPRRAILNTLLPDVHIFTDAAKGGEGGASPGYGLTLVATTTSGIAYAAQAHSLTLETALATAASAAGVGGGGAASGVRPRLPEDVGRVATELLLDEVSRGGCVDALHQPLVLTLMALCPEDVSRVRLGSVTPAAVATLRLLRAFLGVTFKLTPEVAATAAAATSSTYDESVEVGSKRRRRGEAAEATGDGSSDDEEGEAAAAGPPRDPVTGMPITAATAPARSGTSVMVTCLGCGMKNVAKKVS